MVCSECGNVAMRLGTKGRAYCSTHEQKAWEQVGEEGKGWDARHQHDWDDRRLELHRMHLGAA